MAPCARVYEHATFLKEVEDALSIRRKLADLLETASLPGVSDAEARRMLSVLVVGGGKAPPGMFVHPPNSSLCSSTVFIIRSMLDTA